MLTTKAVGFMRSKNRAVEKSLGFEGQGHGGNDEVGRGQHIVQF